MARAFVLQGMLEEIVRRSVVLAYMVCHVVTRARVRLDTCATTSLETVSGVRLVTMDRGVVSPATVVKMALLSARI